jgi:hypothetical protein
MSVKQSWHYARDPPNIRHRQGHKYKGSKVAE